MSENAAPWSKDIKAELMKSIDSIDDFIDARWRSLKTKLGMDGVPAIQPYVGYANDQFVWLQGRVLTNPPKDLPSEDDNWWDNLVQTYRRFESDEVPGVKVEIDFAGKQHHVVTDEEGYFQLQTERVPDVRGNRPWKSATVRIVGNSAVTPEESATAARILTPPETARVGIISDIDDTILHTGITNLLTAAKLTFLQNARSRKPLAGVASLYRAIQDGIVPDQLQNNPVFYVSSSPWNLFDLLEDFLDMNNIPAGPILLRDIGFDEGKFIKEGHGHKLTKARMVMDAYPDLPFVLFGDSGQEDPKLYAEAAVERPEQIKAIFIRDVDPGVESKYDSDVAPSISEAQAAGVPMHLIQDSNEAALKLREMDFISDDWIQRISRDVARDNAI